MFVDRPWNKISLMRLASGLLICFGVTSLVPLLLGAWIGTSIFSPEEIKHPEPISQAVLLRSNSPPILHQILSSLASVEELSKLREQPAPDERAASPASASILTNLLNRALLEPRLRSPEVLRQLVLSDPTRERLRSAATDLDRIQVNRLILQDAFPGALRPVTHRRELAFTSVRSAQFMSANLVLQIGLFWILTVFLRDEGLSWRQFIRGSSERPLECIPFAIGVGIASTILLLAVSAFSTWVWSLLDHAPQLQQPLLILQQSSGPLEKLVFTYLAIAGAPFFEELFFRGILYPTLRQWGLNRAAWILSAALFGFIHLDREKFLPLTLFALILIAVYERSRTLIAPILTHASFNLVNFLLFVNQDALRAAFKRSPFAP